VGNDSRCQVVPLIQQNGCQLLRRRDGDPGLIYCDNRWEFFISSWHVPLHIGMARWAHQQQQSATDNTDIAVCCLSVLLQEVQAESANLSEFQQRLVDFYLHEARTNGITLVGEDRKKFLATLHQLLEDKKFFQ